MNLNGNSVIVKKRAMDPDLRSDMTALMVKAKKVMEERHRLLAKNDALVEEVKGIKRKNLEDLEDVVFDAAEKIRERGVKVFVAKKPIDVAEYVRGIVGRERLGIVPSPQTIEAEVMQAFFMSNKVDVLSDKYAGQEGGTPSVHPYFPYPQGKAKARGSDAKHAVISALVATEGGKVYLEEEEAKVMERFEEPFVIVTADRIFSDYQADRVEHLMEVASGKAVQAARMELKGRLIILDNGRLALARSELKDILMCINCYACSLYCPVYMAVGGLFGSPMMAGIGALSVSYQSGLKAGMKRGLNYCMLCRRCEVECPMGVPIADLVRKMRRKAQFSGL